MTRCSAYTPRSFVKPAHAVARKPADRVSPAQVAVWERSPGCEETSDNLLVFLHYTSERATDPRPGA
jgi:hypothetical protein